MDNLLSELNKVSTGAKSPSKDNSRGSGARATNRSITCSEDLRNRLRVMAANKGVPMQELLEGWIRKGLEEEGF